MIAILSMPTGKKDIKERRTMISRGLHTSGPYALPSTGAKNKLGVGGDAAASVSRLDWDIHGQRGTVLVLVSVTVVGCKGSSCQR